MEGWMDGQVVMTTAGSGRALADDGGSLLYRLSNQMCEQRVQQEQDRTRLQQQHSAEKDSLVQECQREVGSLERRARATLLQHQQHTQEWRQRDAQVGGLL